MASSTSPSRLVGDSMRRAFKTGSPKFGGPQRRYRRAARCWFSSFAKPERHSGAKLMKNDSENGTGVPAHLVSRRTFMVAAASVGGAGIVSAPGLDLMGDRPTAAKIDQRRSHMESPIEVVRRFCAAWNADV